MQTPALMLLWLAVLASCALVAALYLRIPQLRAHIERVEASRLGALDGLRGVLALSVFVHHAYLTRQNALSGVWGTPGNAFVQILGLGAVAIFFMITAFLFWSRAIAADGRMAPLPLYGARLRRLFPAYAGSITLLLFIAACETHFQMREAPWTVVVEIARQYSLGIANGATVNGLANANTIDAGVPWSLGFECGFYAALPLLALSIRSRRSWLAVLAIAAVAIAFGRHLWIVACFLPGIAAAEAAARPLWRARFERHGRGLFFGGCALLALSTIVKPEAMLTLEHGPRLDVLPQIAALCAIFSGVALGPGPRVLRRIELRYLGAISYSVYLLHAIVLYVAAQLCSLVAPLGSLSPMTDWLLVVFVCSPIVVTLATGSYLAFEAPFLYAVRGRKMLRASPSLAAAEQANSEPPRATTS